MEKDAGKRERIEERDESRRSCECEEWEGSPTKRLCKDSDIAVVCEILSKMDNEDLGLGSEEIGEELVCDMMKMLEEEIAPSPSGTDNEGTSSNGSNESEGSGNEDCTFKGELDYLFGASDDELGIPGSPSVQTVNDFDYNSNGFFECLEIQDAERQLLLPIWLGYGESVDEEGSDLFSVHDLHILSNQIDSRFQKG